MALNLTPYEVFWIFGAPAVVFSWYHIFRHMVGFVPHTEKLSHNPHPKVIFEITARKLNPSIKFSVDSIKSSCAEVGFSNYEIKLVVDEPGDNIDDADTILVPKDFTCKSKYKARAMHYALRFLPNSKDAWILHLDEDAKVTAQGISSIIKYIQKGGKPIANGPSVYPYRGNILTFYAEAQRQWTFYWLKDQLQTSTVHWLNGSNLLIRSDIEQAVGWDFVNCYISEDSRFGYEATKKFGRIFGWHGGLTIEKPPVRVKDILTQRVRWFFGGILNLRYVPKGRLPRRIYSMLAWLNGLILTLLFFILVGGVYHEPWFSHWFVIHGFTVTALFWLSRYQIGLYQNLRYSPISKIKKALLHAGLIVLAPVTDLLCTLPTVLSFIQRPKSFEITGK
jgi:cellulose synthase/poly-beta-1,6-N-acetylglucosamine synthase-like glycosyltransferase